MSSLDVPNYFKDFLWLTRPLAAPLCLFMLLSFLFFTLFQGKYCGERFQ